MKCCSTTSPRRWIERGIDGIAKRLDRAVEKGTDDRRRARDACSNTSIRVRISRTSTSTWRSKPRPNGSILKLELFRKLNESTPPEAILATNTSSLSITKIGAVTTRPERVIGMHFMNPVPVMKLVEIIRGLLTSDETYRAVVAIREGAGQDSRRREGLSGLRLEPNADADDQRGDLRAV